jgi:hypothetical protein
MRLGPGDGFHEEARALQSKLEVLAHNPAHKIDHFLVLLFLLDGAVTENLVKNLRGMGRVVCVSVSDSGSRVARILGRTE